MSARRPLVSRDGEGPAPELNMTPMIDIVFNLVTFFLLTLDLTTKDLAPLTLPRARHGVQDVEPVAPAGVTLPAHERLRFVVNLETSEAARGRDDPFRGVAVYFKGRRYPLGDATPEVRAKSLDALKAQLRVVQRDPACAQDLVDPDVPNASRLKVSIRADRETQWRYVQWVMDVCAEVGIYRLHFAVENPVNP